MKLENGIFSESYKISFTHTGVNGDLTNKSFLLFMENVAESHSKYCHLSFEDIEKIDLTWIILSWKLKVFKRPKSGDTIHVKTWVRSVNKFFIYRDFEMFDDDNNLCGIASSNWALVNFKTSKLYTPTERLEKDYGGFNSKEVFDNYTMPKIILPESKPDVEDSYKIRKFDLDLNKHVHNLNYLNYAYEVLPIEMLYENEFNNFEIVYRKELKLGNIIKTSLYKVDNAYIISIKSEDEEKLHAVIKLYND